MDQRPRSGASHPACHHPQEDGSGWVRRRYAKEAARYERRWREYLRRSLDATLRELSIGPGERVLDVGCGTGALLEAVRGRWPGAAGVGVDLSLAMLAIARRRLPPPVALVAADAGRLPFADGTFDQATCTSALHHWTDPVVGLAEVARVLRPGGRLVLTDWSDDDARLRLFSRLLRLFDRSHQRSYRASEARFLLETAGFRVDRIRHFRAGWVWGMMTLTARRVA
jgi:ubiquinone/menaquinone biosynthesis C-methylase UbiE